MAETAVMLHRLRQMRDAEWGPGASDHEIRSAEVRLAVAFPMEYRSFLREVGWAAIGPLEVFGLGPKVPRYLDVVAMTVSERRDARPPLPATLIPIANDGAGNLYCLDAEADTDRAAVVFWDHDRPPAEEPERVADDFAEWVIDRLDNM